MSTGSIIEGFTTGTGEDIYTDSIIPLVLSAKEEVIFVTCFWTQSPSLTKLCAALFELSQKSLAEGLPKIRVRLCFSSRSLFQKLLHTSSPRGHQYPPSAWVSKLGLPPAEQLQGLELQIKSVFFLPFSVLHPKFVIVDRKSALFPSCNVSWETWLECCLKVSGPIVGKLLAFWAETWEVEDPALYRASQKVPFPEMVPTCLLPSPHHRNPRFRPLFLRAPQPPLTPLNVYLLDAFSGATHSIDIVTPNLTSKPVLSALIKALSRGVNVNIATCRRMMEAEQLATAGTTTEFCIWRLKRRYNAILRKDDRTWAKGKQARIPRLARDSEEGHQSIGRLNIKYFTSMPERPEVSRFQNYYFYFRPLEKLRLMCHCLMITNN